MELEKDLLARQEARELARVAQKAQKALADFSQEQIDEICQAIAKAFEQEAGTLAELAVQETGFGNVPDKTTKNRFAARDVWEAIRELKTVGIISREEGLWQVRVPVGVIAAIVPSTNPTSTVCYKALIALKARNTIVFSPHPKALRCTLTAVRLIAKAAETAGAPAGSVGCLTIPAMAGCQELMGAREVNLILATGGPGMVRAAYSSGKPAIGVGAGNGPAYIHSSADLPYAVDCILRSKTFDNGTVCASEQSVIVERSMEEAFLKEARARGFYLMDPREAGLLASCLFRPGGALDPAIVGRTAEELAKKAGFQVPPGTKILLAREQEAGPTRPYSMEKLCPVLALFVMDRPDQVLAKAVEVLSHEGSGHTFVIHARDQGVIEEFALQVPVSRFLVNTPAALGGIGATTRLFPALTLGCGAVGGSSSSNNISPLDLMDIRRVAWDRERKQGQEPQGDLLERLTEEILKRLK